MKNYYQTIYIVATVIFLILGCKNLSTDLKGSVSLKDLKISADKEGKIETRNFKPGDTLYADAQVLGDTSKVKVSFYLTDERDRELFGSKIIVNLAGSENAYFTLKFPPDFGAGKFKIVAELIRDPNSPKTFSVTQLSQAIEVK